MLLKTPPLRVSIWLILLVNMPPSDSPDGANCSTCGHLLIWQVCKSNKNGNQGHLMVIMSSRHYLLVEYVYYLMSPPSARISMLQLGSNAHFSAGNMHDHLHPTHHHFHHQVSYNHHHLRLGLIMA